MIHKAFRIQFLISFFLIKNNNLMKIIFLNILTTRLLIHFFMKKENYQINENFYLKMHTFLEKLTL